MAKPVTDDDRVVGVGQAKGYDPISTANEFNINIVNKDQTNDVAIDATETVTFQPPPEKAWIIRGLTAYLWGTPNATSGSHNMKIFQPSDINTILCASDYGQKVGLWRNTLLGNLDKYPADGKTALQALFRLLLTNSHPLNCSYTNSTDAILSEDREYRLLYQEVRKTT